MRPLPLITAMVLTLTVIACGEEESVQADQDAATSSSATSETSTSDATEDEGDAPTPEQDVTPDAEQGEDSEADDASEAETCLHPCLNEFDQNDKKLCPDPKSDWRCEEGCCVPVFRCTTDSECATQGFEEGQCTDPSLSCNCDVESGSCFSAACSSSEQCADTMVCASGKCVAIPEASDVLLRIVSRPTVLVPGASTPILVEGYVAASPDIRLNVEVTWSSDSSETIEISEEGVATGGASAGSALLTATHSNGVSATLSLRNVVPAAGDTLTAIAVSEGTTTAVAGHYALVDATTGETITSGAIPEDGVLRSNHVAEAGIDVHVFAEGHDWASHLGVSTTALLIPMPLSMWGQIAMSPEGGLTDETQLVGATVVEGVVDMGAYEKAGEVELSLSALPFTSTLFDFNLESILGANVKRYFHPDSQIPGVDTNETLEMPGGLTFAFSGPAVPTYVLAVPAGTSTMWTLGGRIGLDEIFAFSDDIFAAFNGGSINFGELASYLMPFFTEFWSGLTTTPDLSTDEMALHTVDTTLQVPLDLSADIMVPDLPTIGELGHAATVFAIGGALTADERFYPLGLAAAGDTSDPAKWPADGLIDGIEETPEQDPLYLALAPLYAELASPHTSHTTAVVALSIRDDGNDPRPEGGSAIFVRQPAGAGHDTSFPERSFLAFSLESSWDQETRSVSAQSVEGGDTMRLLFKGRSGDNWTLWLNGRETYTVPSPSALVEAMEEDRAADPYNTLISNFDLSEEVDLETLRQPGAPSIEALLHTVDRTSFVEL